VRRSFSVEANLSEMEGKFFLLRNKTEGFVSPVSLRIKQQISDSKRKGKKAIRSKKAKGKSN
jgi:hypothetical protein